MMYLAVFKKKTFVANISTITSKLKDSMSTVAISSKYLYVKCYNLKMLISYTI